MKFQEEIGLISTACGLRYFEYLPFNAISSRPVNRVLQIQSAEVFRYKPGKRCLIKYSGIDTSGRHLELLGKIRFKGIDRRSAELQRELYSKGFDGDEGYSVPLVYGELASLNMWLQEFVRDGRSLTVESSLFIAAQKRVARALARLHRTSITSDKIHTIDDELALLESRFKQLRKNHPQFAPIAETLQSTVAEIAWALQPSVCQTTIHRDFYFEQILISESQSILVDLDLCCIGPPELDIGNYIGHLREYSIRHPQFARRCQEAEQVFEQTYFDQMPSTSRKTVELWARLTLARHVSLSTLLPGRSHTTYALVRKVNPWEPFWSTK